MDLFIAIYLFAALLGFLAIGERKLSIVLRRNTKKDYSDIYLKVVFLILFIFCAFRHPSIGTDTQTYIKSFLSPTFLDLTIDGGEKFELGYKLLVHIIRRFSLNPQVYIIVVTIIIFGGMYKFIKDNCKGYFSVAIVIYIGLLYYTNFSAIRQCIALAFAVNSYTFLKKRKWVQASIIIIVAGLFHTTAWILLIFIPLSFTEWTRKKIVIAILGSSIGILLFEKVVDIVIKILPVYARYWNGAAMDSSGSSIGIFAILVGFLCVVAIYIIFTKWETFYNKAERNEYILALTGSVFAVFVNLLGRRYGIFSRISRYFIPFAILLTVCLVRNYIKNKYIVYIGICIIMGVYFYVIMNGNIYKIIPYKMFFE